MNIAEGVAEALQLAIQILTSWWWVILPIILAIILWDIWLNYIRGRYIANIDWVLLQLTVPQEVVKSPLAMEQIFAGLYSIKSGGNFWEKYFKGKVQEWFSLEIVSEGGKIYFFIRTPQKNRNLVESYIYSQYPDAEINEVEDYVYDVPETIPSAGYDLKGTEFILEKEDAYPIRVWRDFEFESKEGEANVDPIAGLIESLSQLKEGEKFWLQLGIKPIGDDWKKEGEEIVSKLIGREVKDDKKKSHIMKLLKKEAGDYLSGTLQAPFEPPVFESLPEDKKDKDGGPPSLIQFLSPGEREVVEAIERNIAKVGFECTIRAIYLAQEDVFDKSAFGTITASLKQFSTQNLNSFKSNSDAKTSQDQPFKKRKENFRKNSLLHKYRSRGKPEKSFILSIEELATIYHFPGHIVTSPTVPRIEVKKGEPPSTLPTS